MGISMRLSVFLSGKGGPVRLNAYVLGWTMNDYPDLRAELARLGLHSQDDEGDLRLAVPFDRLNEVVPLLQKHFNAPYNYVDIQFPDQQLTVIVFQHRQFMLRNPAENAAAQRWAIAQGLPPQQADWGTSF